MPTTSSFLKFCQQWATPSRGGDPEQLSPPPASDLSHKPSAKEPNSWRPGQEHLPQGKGQGWGGVLGMVTPAGPRCDPQQGFEETLGLQDPHRQDARPPCTCRSPWSCVQAGRPLSCCGWRRNAGGLGAKTGDSKEVSGKCNHRPASACAWSQREESPWQPRPLHRGSRPLPVLPRAQPDTPRSLVGMHHSQGMWC